MKKRKRRQDDGKLESNTEWILFNLIVIFKSDESERNYGLMDEKMGNFGGFEKRGRWVWLGKWIGGDGNLGGVWEWDFDFGGLSLDGCY